AAAAPARRGRVVSPTPLPPHAPAAPAPADADAADVDPIIRAQNPRVDVCVIDRRSARRGYTGLDEVSACGLLSHTSLLGNGHGVQALACRPGPLEYGTHKLKLELHALARC